MLSAAIIIAFLLYVAVALVCLTATYVEGRSAGGALGHRKIYGAWLMFPVAISRNCYSCSGSKWADRLGISQTVRS